MPSTKKLQTYKRSDFGGPRRAKPSVRQLNRSVREQLAFDHSMMEAVIADADIRRAFIVGMGLDVATHSVWNDFDHTTGLTELHPRDLKEWRDLTEYAKIQLLWQAALQFGGYSFSANIRPDLEDRWEKGGVDPMDRVRRLTRKALEATGLHELHYFWVMEGRSRHGGTKTPLHLHGFLVTSDPHEVTQFKVAMEAAISSHPKGKLAAGYAPRSGKPVHTKPAFDKRDGSIHGRGRWARYMTKNAMSRDARVSLKRTFMSREGTQLARVLWALIREEPLV